MFTVLYRHADGTEEFFEARAVNYLSPQHPNPENICAPPRADKIGGGVPGMILTLGDGGVVQLFREHPTKVDMPTPEVFVMNRDGKTVGRYYMN